MSFCEDKIWLQERITKTKAIIEAYEDAILAIGTNGIQRYKLDTGQTSQEVTKVDLSWMEQALSRAENRLAVLQARLCGTGSTYARPGF